MNNRSIIKIIPISIITFCAFIISFIILIRIPYYWGRSLSIQLLILVSCTILLTILFWFFYIKCFEPRSRSFSAIDIAGILTISLIFGSLIRSLVPIPTAPFSPINPSQLDITSRGERNPLSSGSDVIIHDIRIAEHKINPGSLTLIGSWKDENGILISHLDQPSRIHCSIENGTFTQIDITFGKGPTSGMAEISSYNFTRKYDLYERAYQRSGIYSIPVYANPVWQILEGIAFGIFFFAVFLFVISSKFPEGRLISRLPEWILLPTPGERSKDNSAISSKWIDGFYAILLGVIGLLACIFMAPRGHYYGFVDMAHDGYQLRTALDILKGAFIFRDTFTQYGPMPDYVNAFALKVMGERLLSMKYMASLVYGVIFVLQYFISKYFLPRSASFLSGLVWIAAAPFWMHGVMVSPHLYSILFELISVVLMLQFIRRPKFSMALLSGLACGIMFTMKENIGVFNFIALFIFLSFYVIFNKDSHQSEMTTLRKISFLGYFCAGFFGFLAIVFTWLWSNNAIKDWYLQTIAISAAYGINPKYTVAINLPLFSQTINIFLGKVISFFNFFLHVNVLTLATGGQIQDISWHIVRYPILIFTMIMLLRKNRKEISVILMALVAFFAWLGMIPSNNFMHQWWALSAVFPCFVYIVWKGLSRFRQSSRTIILFVILSVLFIPGMVARVNYLKEETAKGTWSTIIQSPPVLSGIRTDAYTAALFQNIYSDIESYRILHPAAPLMTLSSPWNGSLMMLSFIDQNPSFHPAYWNVENVIQNIYPDYYAKMVQYIHQKHPLIISEVNHGYNNGLLPQNNTEPYCGIMVNGYKIYKAYSGSIGDQYMNTYEYRLLEPSGSTDIHQELSGVLGTIKPKQEDRNGSISESEIDFTNGLSLIAHDISYTIEKRNAQITLHIQNEWMAKKSLDNIHLQFYIQKEKAFNPDLFPSSDRMEIILDIEKPFMPQMYQSDLCLTETSSGGSPVTILPDFYYSTMNSLLLADSISGGTYSIWLAAEDEMGNPLEIQDTTLPMTGHYINVGEFSIDQIQDSLLSKIIQVGEK